MKLHLCCGTVYLEGYMNVDIQGFLKSEVEAMSLQFNKTTIDRYYRNPLKSKPLSRRGNFVVDVKLDLLLSWPWNDNSIDEIVMVQSIEHFLPDEADFLVSEVYRVLKKGSAFIFDFPDIVSTVMEYSKSDFKYMSRLVYCNHKDIYSVHKNAYNEDTFTELLTNSDREWKSIEWRKVIEHDYPTIGGIAIK
jgi:SAM-dependent methyltransferase